jgi:hypothetical protein
MCVLYSNDGPMPILPGFDPLARMRREELPEFFPGTTGLISQGQRVQKKSTVHVKL